MKNDSHALSSRLLADASLLVVTIIWGYTFVVQRTAANHLGAFGFNAIRLFVAAVALTVASLVFPPPKWKRQDLLPGAQLGLLLFLGLGCQQLGLAHTTAGKGGFITGLYVLLVPIELRLFWGRKVPRAVWFGSLLALFGLFLLSGEKDFSINGGDIWVFSCAVLFGFHVIFIEEAVKRSHPLKLAILQNGIASVLSGVTSFFIESNSTSGVSAAIPEILFAGIVSSGIAYTVQIYAQRHTPASTAAIICSLESVFAAIAGLYFLNEMMSRLQLIGCACIFVGTIYAIQGSLAEVGEFTGDLD